MSCWRNGAARPRLDVGVKSVAVADNGGLYDLESGGALYLYTASGWAFEDSGVQQVLLLRGGAMLDRESGGGHR